MSAPSRFNLSAWSLRNRGLVLYAMIVLALVGAWSYAQLGQSEDPPFTFRAMVVQTAWPGATAEEVSRQVTERIEQAVMATGQYEFVRSYSRPGESQVILMAREDLPSGEVPDLWYEIRKKVGDIRHTLPEGVVGPFFNDEFGETYGNIYALTGPGFDYAVLEDHAERLELELQRVEGVGRIELLGLQDEKVWIEVDNARLATLGVPVEAVRDALHAQNAVVPAGFFETSEERVRVRVDGRFESVDAIRDAPVRANGRTFRLGDVARVTRGFADPAAPRMRFQGEDAIGIAVAMAEGGDILALGDTLDAEFERLARGLPAGMELRRVADQPRAVRDSVGEFMRVLAEAVAIVLLVSFFSLGWRTGLVVAVSIPLVLAMTFAAMHAFDIGLHKISLGALVLALGLLVDDAIIAVEMMAIKMEQGLSRLQAAAFAWESTAFPMLTGTLVTAAGFLPIATAESSVGEYTRSLFEVVVIALVVSWVVAVLFIPWLGDRMLPAPKDTEAHDPYATRFYDRFRTLLEACLRRRWLVIGATAAMLVLSVLAFRFVPQQFFPDSTRLELMVDLELAEGSSLDATTDAAGRLEALLLERDDIDQHAAFIGTGAPRFYLPLDQQLPATNFAQFVVRAEDLEAREAVRDWLVAEVVPQFPTLQMRVTRLENGPPVGYPVQFRVSGEHIDQVRAIARDVQARVRAHPATTNANLDWSEPSKVVRLRIDQDRARALGVSSAHLSQVLARSLSGMQAGTYREGNELIGIELRGDADERGLLEALPGLSVPTAGGDSVPLSQVATIEPGFEHGIIWHRDRLPTVTVRADIAGELLPAQVTADIEPTLDPIREALPPGYLLETGGTVEDSARGQDSINAGMPLFLLVVVTLLMLQLRSFPRTVLVLLTAPLGLIGVVLFLLVSRTPFGFVAMLGTIALAGMIMRNSVILVDQIDQDIAAGSDRWTAILDATVRRFRPIVLTALAAILAMIPLSRSVFFGPMAVAIMGGLTVATALTLLVLPALYAAWFGVKPGEAGRRPRPVLQ